MFVKGEIHQSALKDTFWNKKRIEKGVTLDVMSKELGLGKSSISMYFTGVKLPSTPIAVKFCDYFGVDYVEGAEEFNKTHESWVAANQGKTRKRSPIRKRKFDTSKTKVSDKSALAELVPKAKKPNTTNRDIAALVYGKASYEVFTQIYDNKLMFNDILPAIYGDGDVDYDTYCKVYEALEI